MALGGKKSGSAVFLGSSAEHSVVRWSAKPAYILGRCGQCGCRKDCDHVAFDGSMSNLTGSFICECGVTVRLSVSLGFKKSQS